MANYIGNSPSKGEFRKVDALTFNGTTTTFNLTTGTVAFNVGSATQLIVSLNGVIQEPHTTYNVVGGGSQIQFTTAPTAGTNFFAVALSGLGDEATVGDGQVTTTKIADGSVTTTKIADSSVTPAKMSSSFGNTYSTKGTAIALSIALG